VVECYLDCGNPQCEFARFRCHDIGADLRLLTLPPGRRYTSGMVRGVDSLSGVAVLNAAGKGISYR
jgi:hypothetical protein